MHLHVPLVLPLFASRRLSAPAHETRETPFGSGGSFAHIWCGLLPILAAVHCNYSGTNESQPSRASRHSDVSRCSRRAVGYYRPLPEAQEVPIRSFRKFSKVPKVIDWEKLTSGVQHKQSVECFECDRDGLKKLGCIVSACVMILSIESQAMLKRKLDISHRLRKVEQFMNFQVSLPEHSMAATTLLRDTMPCTTASHRLHHICLPAEVGCLGRAAQLTGQARSGGFGVEPHDGCLKGGPLGGPLTASKSSPREFPKFLHGSLGLVVESLTDSLTSTQANFDGKFDNFHCQCITVMKLALQSDSGQIGRKLDSQRCAERTSNNSGRSNSDLGNHALCKGFAVVARRCPCDSSPRRGYAALITFQSSLHATIFVFVFVVVDGNMLSFFFSQYLPSTSDTLWLARW